MVGRFRKCERFSGFLYGMLMLLTLAANCSRGVCKQTQEMQQQERKRFSESLSIINDILQLTKEMYYKAKILFNESVTEHDIFVNRCKKHPNSTHENSENLLNATDEALIYFKEAFNVLFFRHKNISGYKHTKKLEEAREQIQVLQFKLLNFLKSCNKSLEDVLTADMQKAVRTKYDLPHSNDLYKQKYECCQLINIYKEFLKVVEENFEQKNIQKKCFKHPKKVLPKIAKLNNLILLTNN